MKRKPTHSAPCHANRRILGLGHSSANMPGGFTFIEILFAVIILGVGMIMIAGMLPVAIKQNAETRNDLTANTVAQNGYAYLKTLIQTHPEAFPETSGLRTDTNVYSIPNIPTNPAQPLGRLLNEDLMTLDSTDEYTLNGGFPTNVANPPFRRAGRVIPLSMDVMQPLDAVTNGKPDVDYRLPQLLDNEVNNVSPNISEYPLAWHQTILADRISAGDARYQWLAFYRRDEGSKVVKLIIVAMRLHNTDVAGTFNAGTTLVREGIQSTVTGGAGVFDGTHNGPFLVPIQIEDGFNEPDRVKFVQTGANPLDVELAQTGSYLIIAHSPPLNGNADSHASAPGDLARPYRNNGRVFRLAARRDDLDDEAGGARVWDLAPGFDLPIASPGADGIPGTADDIADGSMNVDTLLPENAGPKQVRPTNTATYVNKTRIVTSGTEKFAQGTTAWAWIIGRGRLDPSGTTASSFTGPTQDLAVLSVDVPIE